MQLRALNVKAKTGKQIHDFIEKHKDLECPKRTKWVKLEDAELTIEELRDKIQRLIGEFPKYSEFFDANGEFHAEEFQTEQKVWLERLKKTVRGN